MEKYSKELMDVIGLEALMDDSKPVLDIQLLAAIDSEGWRSFKGDFLGVVNCGSKGFEVVIEFMTSSS